MHAEEDPNLTEPQFEEGVLKDALLELARNRRREQVRHAARRPKRIGDVLTRLMARQGYARVQSSQELEDAWRDAVGQPLADQTRIGRLRRGVLEVVVSHSAVGQELTYAKRAILARLVQLVPDQTIRDLRVRSGPIS